MKTAKNRLISCILLFLVFFNIVLSALPGVVYAATSPLKVYKVADELENLPSFVRRNSGPVVIGSRAPTNASTQSGWDFLYAITGADTLQQFQAEPLNTELNLITMGGWDYVGVDLDAILPEFAGIIQASNAWFEDPVKGVCIKVTQQVKDYIAGLGAKESFIADYTPVNSVDPVKTPLGSRIQWSLAGYGLDTQQLPFTQDWTVSPPFVFTYHTVATTRLQFIHSIGGLGTISLYVPSVDLVEGDYIKFKIDWNASSYELKYDAYGYHADGSSMGVIGNNTYSGVNWNTDGFIGTGITGFECDNRHELTGVPVENPPFDYTYKSFASFNPESLSKTGADNLVVGSTIFVNSETGEPIVDVPEPLPNYGLNLTNHEQGLMAYLALQLGVTFNSINDYKLFMYQFKNFLNSKGVGLTSSIKYDDTFKGYMTEFASSFNSLTKPTLEPITTTYNIPSGGTTQLNRPFVTALTTTQYDRAYFDFDVQAETSGSSVFNFNYNWKNTSGTETPSVNCSTSTSISLTAGYKYKFYIYRYNSTTWKLGYYRIDASGNSTDMGAIASTAMPNLAYFKINYVNFTSVASSASFSVPQPQPTYDNALMASFNPSLITVGNNVSADGITSLEGLTSVVPNNILNGRTYLDADTVPDVLGDPVADPITDPVVDPDPTPSTDTGFLENISNGINSIVNFVGDLITNLANMLKSLFIPSTLSFPVNLEDNLFGQFISFLDFSSLFSITPTPFQFDVDFGALSFGGNNFGASHYSFGDIAVLNDNIGTIRNFTSLTILIFTVFSLFRKALPQRTMD